VKKLTIIAIAAVAGVSSAAIFENGPVINGNSGGAGGDMPNSILTSSETLFGFGTQSFLGNMMADNFTVTGAGWNVSRLAFYSYQSFATTGFTFTGANVSIVTGSDPNAGTVVLNLTNAAVANDGFVGYRVTSTTLKNEDRSIYRVGVAAALSLSPGNYMLRWSLAGSAPSGPWTPPVTPAGPNGNGYRAIENGLYKAAMDTGSDLRQEIPFQITYDVVPEPATMLALGAGLAAIAARRRRK